MLADTDIGGGIFVRDPDGQLIELLPMAYAERVGRGGDDGARATRPRRDRHRLESRHRTADRAQLAREGAHIVLNARNASALEETAHECEAHGVRVVRVVADLFDPTPRRMVVERALDELGRIDILVNNAGGGGAAVRLQKVTNDDWQRGFELNFFSCVRITTACLPTMLERGWARGEPVVDVRASSPGPLRAVLGRQGARCSTTRRTCRGRSRPRACSPTA